MIMIVSGFICVFFFFLILKEVLTSLSFFVKEDYSCSIMTFLFLYYFSILLINV